MAIHTRIKLRNAKNKCVGCFDEMCLANFGNFLSRHRSARTAVFSFEKPYSLTNEELRCLVEGYSKMWFFGEYLQDIDKIVKDEAYTFDLMKITGFDFYSIVSILRNIESFGRILEISGFDFERFAKDSDGGMYYMNFMVTGGTKCPSNRVYYRDGHSLWPKTATCPVSQISQYRFVGLKEKPKQVCMREQPYWNLCELGPNGNFFEIQSYYLPGNTY